MRISMKRLLATLSVTVSVTAAFAPGAIAQDDGAQPMAAAPLSGLKAEAAAGVDARAKLTQEIVDSLFSFSELGFQEFETQRYLTTLLEENGFSIEHGVSDIPSAWWATWGSGEPVIALGSDVDGIPKSSQMPGVIARQPMVEGAPGHGEGHNSGQAVNIAAALAVKEIMEREKLPGTLVLVSNELGSGIVPTAASTASTRCCLRTCPTRCPYPGDRQRARASYPSSTPSTASPRTVPATPGRDAAPSMPSNS